MTSDVIALTIGYDDWMTPNIPPMRTFFRPTAIWRELSNTSGPHDADNMALIFHEALHAYTRLPDSPGLFSVPNLKKVLGCDVNFSGTYDITAFLMQFTEPIPPMGIDNCSTFTGQLPPTVPPQ